MWLANSLLALCRESRPPWPQGLGASAHAARQKHNPALCTSLLKRVECHRTLTKGKGNDRSEPDCLRKNWRTRELLCHNMYVCVTSGASGRNLALYSTELLPPGIPPCRLVDFGPFPMSRWPFPREILRGTPLLDRGSHFRQRRVSRSLLTSPIYWDSESRFGRATAVSRPSWIRHLQRPRPSLTLFPLRARFVGNGGMVCVCRIPYGARVTLCIRSTPHRRWLPPCDWGRNTTKNSVREGCGTR